MFDVYKQNRHDDIEGFLRDKELLKSPLESVARDAIAKAAQAIKAKDFSEDPMRMIVLVACLQRLTHKPQPVSEYLKDRGLAEGHGLGMEDLKAWTDRNLELRATISRDLASTIAAGTGSMSGDDNEMDGSWIVVDSYPSERSA